MTFWVDQAIRNAKHAKYILYRVPGCTECTSVQIAFVRAEAEKRLQTL
jgi:hypothetical protein